MSNLKQFTVKAFVNNTIRFIKVHAKSSSDAAKLVVLQGHLALEVQPTR